MPPVLNLVYRLYHCQWSTLWGGDIFRKGVSDLPRNYIDGFLDNLIICKIGRLGGVGVRKRNISFKYTRWSYP